MGVTSVTLEAACAVNPARMFEALLLDGDNLLPKLMHQGIKSVERIQGDGGAGTIKQVKFAEGGDINYVKNRVDDIDKEKLIYKYTLIEGDGLLEKLESIAYEVKFETSGDGGYVCKMISNYYTVGDNKVEEEVIKAGKERALQMYKVVEAYLLANPDAYN